MFTSAWFLWAVAGLLLVGAEFLVPGLVIIFFGVGALVTALLAAIVPGLGQRYALQALIWIGSSALSLAALRRWFGRLFRSSPAQDEGIDQALAEAEVIERITPDRPGRIRYQGTSWKAVSYTETIEVGERVEILERDNLTFVVTRDA